MRDENGWIQTATGGKFWPLDPKPEDVCIYDIAHALSQLCRFTGHTKKFYSVAQHSVLVSQACGPCGWIDARWGLLHDAAEAYLNDIARPVKRTVMMDGYRDSEEKLIACIAERFGLSLPIPSSVHHADRVLLLTERRDFMHPLEWSETNREAWNLSGAEPLEKVILPWTPEEAEMKFLLRYRELFGGRTTM